MRVLAHLVWSPAHVTARALVHVYEPINERINLD